MTGDVPDYPPSEDLRILYDQVRAGLRRQDDEAQKLRERATTLVASSFLVLGLVVTGIARGAESPSLRLAYAAAVVLIGAGLVVGALAAFSRDLTLVPDPEADYEDFYGQPPNQMLAEFTADVVGAYRANRESGIIPRRGRLVGLQLVTVILAALCLIVGILLHETGLKQ